MIVNLDTNQAFINSCNSGVARFTVNTQTGSVVSQYLIYNGAQYYNGVSAKIGNDVISIIVETYYERVHLFYRDAWDGTSLSNVHNEKVYFNYGTGGILWTTDSKVYAYCARDASRFSVYSYDMSSQAATELKYNDAGVKHIRIPSQFISTDESVKQFYVPRTDGANKIGVELWSLDTDNGSVTNVQTCTINWGDVTPTINVNDSRFALHSWITKDADGNLYLHLVTVCRNDYNPSDTKYGIYTFAINSTDYTQLTCLGFTDFGRKIYGIVPLTLNNDKLIVNTAGETYTASFNGNDWTLLSLGTGEAKAILYDTSGRLWIVNTSNNYKLLTPTIPLKPKMWFEPEETSYDGTTQTVKLYIDTFNMYGERIAVSGKLIVRFGDVEFEGGAKVKEITTSTTGPTEVDVYVTGPADGDIVFVVSL